MIEVFERKRYREWPELADSEKDRLRWDSSIAHSIREDVRFAISALFRDRLREAKLPDDLDCLWSLGHCQGDGCSVSGMVPMTVELLEAMNVGERFPGIREQLATGDAWLTWRIARHSGTYVVDP